MPNITLASVRCLAPPWCAGLSIQLLLFPNSLDDAEADAAARVRTPSAPQLPKVTVTSSPEEIRRAFEAVARTDSGSGRPVGQGSSAGSGTSSAALNNDSAVHQSPTANAGAEVVASSPSSSSGGSPDAST
jgi:hypothetical protein